MLSYTRECPRQKLICVIAQVYAIDLLGFGRSDKPLLSYSTELWRDQVLDFLAEFVDGPAILVGNSIGSLISLMVGLCPELLCT